MNIEVINKNDLAQYKHLMLSYIYDELDSYPDDLDVEYICLAAYGENPDGILLPVSVVIAQMEPFGDISVLSIYTLPEYRRRGFASELLDKVVFVARRLFVWDEGETEEDVCLKTLYRLRPELETVYEAFLKKNHFTDFYLLEEDEEYKVWSAVAEYHFYRTAEEDGEAPAADNSQQTEQP